MAYFGPLSLDICRVNQTPLLQPQDLSKLSHLCIPSTQNILMGFRFDFAVSTYLYLFGPLGESRPSEKKMNKRTEDRLFRKYGFCPPPFAPGVYAKKQSTHACNEYGLLCFAKRVIKVEKREGRTTHKFESAPGRVYRHIKPFLLLLKTRMAILQSVSPI